MIRVGINGYGRIGRNVHRQLIDHPHVEIPLLIDGALVRPVQNVQYSLAIDAHVTSPRR